MLGHDTAHDVQTGAGTWHLWRDILVHDAAHDVQTGADICGETC